MQRRWNAFPFLITRLITIFKPCLEKSSQDSNKICQLFARIPYNSYFGKSLKMWCQWFQGRHLSWASTFTNLHAVSQQLFHKKFHHRFFFLEFGEFFQNGHKERTWVAIELQKKTKWTITKTPLQTFSRYSEWVLF